MKSRPFTILNTTSFVLATFIVFTVISPQLTWAQTTGSGNDGSSTIQHTDNRDLTTWDDDIWGYLTAFDDALDKDLIYQPVQLLSSENDIEAWLMTARARTEDAQASDSEWKSEHASEYYVIYIQQTPYPKIINISRIGEPLKEIEPSCEIKLLLDSNKILNEENLLDEDITEAFQIEDEPTAFGTIYLDNEERNFYDLGWLNRIRVKEGKSKYTLKYKKRYPIELAESDAVQDPSLVSDEGQDSDPSDVPNAQDFDIDAALALAREDGFSLYDEEFPAEIDWGYSQMTLSFSTDVDLKTKESPDINELERDDAVQMLIDNMPLEEKQQDWGAGDYGLQSVGPFHFLRYLGILDGYEIAIEIWPLNDGDEPQIIVEFSYKADDMEEAAELHGIFIEKLDKMGILLHEDSLKAKMILQKD